MASGHEFSDSINFSVIQFYKDLLPQDMALCNLRYEGERLKWSSDLEALKLFFKEKLGLRLKGKWTSPGGNSKKFKCTNFNVVATWYFKKQQTLLFQGNNSQILKESLISNVMTMQKEAASFETAKQQSYLPPLRPVSNVALLMCRTH